MVGLNTLRNVLYCRLPCCLEMFFSSLSISSSYTKQTVAKCLQHYRALKSQKARKVDSETFAQQALFSDALCLADEKLPILFGIDRLKSPHPLAFRAFIKRVPSSVDALRGSKNELITSRNFDSLESNDTS